MNGFIENKNEKGTHAFKQDPKLYFLFCFWWSPKKIVMIIKRSFSQYVVANSSSLCRSIFLLKSFVRVLQGFSTFLNTGL